MGQNHFYGKQVCIDIDIDSKCPFVAYSFLNCFYVYQGYHFYTELKTVTQLWKESDATDTKAAVSMPVMR